MSSTLQEGLNQREELEKQHDLTVREDIELFRSQAQAFLAGNDRRRVPGLSPPPRHLRPAPGGVQMIRTKIPGGLLTSAQMRQLGRIADEFAGGKGHLTTRQNMQYHFVPLAAGSRPAASAGGRRPHHPRSLLQHRPQRHRVSSGRACTRKNPSTCGPTPGGWRWRSCTRS